MTTILRTRSTTSSGLADLCSDVLWFWPLMCSLQTTLCLQYPPELIAAGAAYTALKLHRVTVEPLPGDHRQWYQRAPLEADAATLEGVLSMSLILTPSI